MGHERPREPSKHKRSRLTIDGLFASLSSSTPTAPASPGTGPGQHLTHPMIELGDETRPVKLQVGPEAGTTLLKSSVSPGLQRTSRCYSQRVGSRRMYHTDSSDGLHTGSAAGYCGNSTPNWFHVNRRLRVIAVLYGVPKQKNMYSLFMNKTSDEIELPVSRLRLLQSQALATASGESPRRVLLGVSANRTSCQCSADTDASPTVKLLPEHQ